MHLKNVPGTAMKEIGQLISGMTSHAGAAKHRDLGSMLHSAMKCVSGLTKAIPGLSLMHPPSLGKAHQADKHARGTDAPQSPVGMLMKSITKRGE